MAQPYAAAAGTEAARDTREVEGMLELSRRLLDVAQRACARTSDMKHRLLGMSEPMQAGAKDGPKVVASELPELRGNLGALDVLLDRLHENLTVLERI